MISDQMKSLILEEQPRQDGHFVRNVDMATYLAKLGEKAEIVSDVIDGIAEASWFSIATT